MLNGNSFNMENISGFYRWLGHGYSQLSAFHKDYKPGREHFQENLKNKALPKIWYARELVAFQRFVRKFHKDHTCCIGINPMPGILRNNKGYPRAAREDDIQVVTSFFFDIDFESKNPTDEELAELRLLLFRLEPYFESLGINQPIINPSGKGFHILFKPTPIYVRAHPEIKEQQLAFLVMFKQEFSRELARLGARCDTTLDLSRVVKLYGTRKPGEKRLSSFEGVTASLT